MKNDLEKFIFQLNQEGMYPETYLRRNHRAYSFVCTINHIICFYLSSNFSAIPLLLQRAYKFLLDFEKNQTTNTITSNYAKLTFSFLIEMANFISLQSIKNLEKELIPKELLQKP